MPDAAKDPEEYVDMSDSDKSGPIRMEMHFVSTDDRTIAEILGVGPSVQTPPRAEQTRPQPESEAAAPEQPVEPEFIYAVEAAERLEVSVHTLRAMARKAGIPVVRMRGEHTKYKADDMQSLFKIVVKQQVD